MQPLPATAHLRSLLGRRMQLGFVVGDLDAAMNYWTQILGFGPFVVFENSVAGRKVTYRGRVTPMETSLAFTYVGDVQIELVWQSNDAPSPYKDFLDSGKQRLQHVAFWPEEFEATCQELSSQGFREVFAMYLEDGSKNVAYFETPPPVGVMVELVPWTTARAEYFGRIKSIVENWDGSRPIRRYASRFAFQAATDAGR